jgi:hypothetical protein
MAAVVTATAVAVAVVAVAVAVTAAAVMEKVAKAVDRQHWAYRGSTSHPPPRSSC